MVGYHTQITVNVTIPEKLCMEILCAENRGKEVEDQESQISYMGRRKDMESSAVLIPTRKV